RPIRFETHPLRLSRAAFDEAVVQRAPPEALERRLVAVGGIGLAHDVVTGLLPSAEQSGEHLVRGLALVERLDQRLHDGHRAVVRARIAPALEWMGRRDVPVTE